MAFAFDIEALKLAVRAILGQQSGPLTTAEVAWMVEVLGHMCSNFRPDELEAIIVKTALEKGDRPLVGLRLDS